MATTPADSGRYVLFFTPEAGVVPHMAAQAFTARVLKEQGHKVLMVRCNTVYSRCPVMDMYILPHLEVEANKQKVCAECNRVFGLFTGAYGLDSVALSDLFTPGLAATVAGALKDAPADLREFSYEGVPFGKLCMMDIVHATKTSQFDSVKPEIRETWKISISSALTTYLLVRSLCERLPVGTIVTHEDYSVLAAARLAGRSLGIPAVTMTLGQHAGGDRRVYQFFHTPGWGQACLTLQSWPRFRELSIGPAQVRSAMDDILARFKATTAHVYSPQKTFEQGDFRDKAGIPKDKKLLVLFTSSLDELLASTSQQEAMDLPRIRLPQTFKDQIEWIKALIQWVKGSEYYLVVRIHPREGANKREGMRSQHLQKLQEAFGGQYENCAIIWPETPISSYDLAEVADLVLVSWSTLGIEVSRLGVPVLASTYGNAFRPWDDFHDWAPTPAQYFRKIKELTGRSQPLDAIKHAFRWYILHYFGYTIDFSDVVPAKDFHGIIPFKTPAAASQVVETLVHGEEVLDRYQARLLASQEDGDRKAEDDEVKRQMRRAIHFLMTQEEGSGDFKLLVALDGKEMRALTTADRMAVEAGAVCLLAAGPIGLEYHFGRQVSRRHSPMALRMALHAGHRLSDRQTPTGGDDRQMSTRGDASWKPMQGGGLAERLAAAGRLRDQGLLKEARKMAEADIRSSGETPEWGTFLGHLDFLEGDPKVAKRTLLEVVDRWPRYGKAHNNLAAIFWSEGNRDRAASHMEKALELDPAQRDIVLNGIRIMTALGRDGEAQRLREAFLAANPAETGQLQGL